MTDSLSPFSYDAKMRLAGIIYLHEITQPRMLGTSRKNLDMFTRLCGPEAIKNVILITTKWDELSSEGIGRLRESQLKGEHWRHMVDMGSRIHRFDGTQRSARRIVNYILAKQPIDAVQIQTELVQIGDLLAETEAGRTLRYTLQELLKMQKAMSTKMRGSSEGDPSMHEKALENEEKIRQTLKQIKELNIPLSRKITKFLGIVVGVIVSLSKSYHQLRVPAVKYSRGKHGHQFCTCSSCIFQLTYVLATVAFHQSSRCPCRNQS